MALDPAYPLQQSVYNALKTLADGRVYHRVPKEATIPYLQIGDDFIVSDYDAADMSDCTVIVNIVAATKPLAKQLAGQVRTALDKLLPVEGFTTVEGWFEEARYRSENDNKSELVVMDFHYLLLPNG
jgi:hypothetical protein